MTKFFLLFYMLMTINLTVISQMHNSISLYDKILNSEMVLCGEVIDSNSFWDNDHKNIFTSYRIKAIEILKGTEIIEVELVLKGGIVDDVWHKVNTSTELEIGTIGCFFLKNSNKEVLIFSNSGIQYSLYGGREGFIKIRDKQDLSLVDRPNSVHEIIEYLEQVQGNNENFKQIDIIKTKNASATHSISGISPLISTAGTGSLLTISGKGFGNSQGNGEVWFVNSEDIYTRYTDKGFEIKVWSDTLIQVVIPDQAATGKVWVKVDENDAESPEILTIRFSINNIRFKPTILINNNQIGGYTWHIDSSLHANTAARDVVKKSIGKWACATQIPWSIGNPINVEPGFNDMSTISFGEVEYALAEANYYYTAITSDGILIEWVVKEMDIVFSENESWSFNRNQIAFDQFDFETVVIHELGHAHMIGHVNSVDDLMYYAIGRQVFKDINSTNIESGLYILNKSLQFLHPDFETVILSEAHLLDNPGVILGESVVCSGQNSVMYSVPPVSNAESYIWSLPFGVEGESTTNSITVNYGPNAISGNITVAGINSCGSGEPSSIMVEVNNKPSAPVITFENGKLFSSASTGNQWYFQDSSIEGATGQEYTLSSSGNYFARVTLNGCSSDKSNIINAVISNVNTYLNNSTFRVYPNPFSDNFIIESGGSNTPFTYEIITIAGETVKKGASNEKSTINTKALNAGLYFLRINHGNRIESRKIFKY